MNQPLMPVRKQVTRGGRTFMQTFYLSPEDIKRARTKKVEPEGKRKPAAHPQEPVSDEIQERFKQAGEWGKKKPWPTNDINEIYKLAEEARPEFKGLVEKLKLQFGGDIMSRDTLKGRARVQEKAEEEAREAEQDEPVYAAITDIDGHTLIMDSPEDVLKVYEHLKDQPWVTRTKNRFGTPLGTGYRDILINVQMSNGAIGELQLSTRSMMDAKMGPGHKLYEAERGISAGFYKKPPAPPKTKRTMAAVTALRKVQSRLYMDAYRSSVSRTNFNAWSSVKGAEWSHMVRALSPLATKLPDTILAAVQGVAEKSNLTGLSSKSPKTMSLGKSISSSIEYGSSIRGPRLMVKLRG